jgi:hypothetical protein
MHVLSRAEAGASHRKNERTVRGGQSSIQNGHWPPRQFGVPRVWLQYARGCGVLFALWAYVLICEFGMQLAGPMWSGPLHNPEFVAKVVEHVDRDGKNYGTSARMKGMLAVAQEVRVGVNA